MFVSGRIHAFVAAVSQSVPTVIITRGFGPISHRNAGFARAVGLENFIADPRNPIDLIEKIEKCWKNKDELRKTLDNKIPDVQDTARASFSILSTIFVENEKESL